MKRLFIIITFILGLCHLTTGQQTDPRVGFTYQALAIDRSQSQGFGRDTQGKVLANQDVKLRFNIRETNHGGDIRYQETHATSTDAFGIFRLVIGRGDSSSEILLEELNWGQVAYFLEIEIDLGDGFQALGTEELHGAPFALNTLPQKLSLENGNELSISHGNMVQLQDNDPNNELLESANLNGPILELNDAGGTISVDLSTIKGEDSSPTNELQDISTNGSAGNITITNGSSLTLNVDDSDASSTNEIQDISTSGSAGNISISDGSTLTLNVDDGDADNTNEIQDLALNGSILTITNNASASPINLSSMGAGAFSTTSNVTSNAPGDYSTDDFVFGSPQLDDNGDPDHDFRMFFDKSKGAFRAGQVDNGDWDSGLIGDNSVAMGFNTRASGLMSTAFGRESKATGTASFSKGWNTTASGAYSSSMGVFTTASNTGAVAMGAASNASGTHSLATGEETAASGSFAVTMGVRSVASGRGSFAMGESSNASGRYSLAAGVQATAEGDFSFAFGLRSHTSHEAALATGIDTEATGQYSTAMGWSTNAIGVASTSLGFTTTASGYASTVLGSSSFASGNITLAGGFGTYSRSFAETSLGTNNTDYVPNSIDSFDPSDRLLVIGNGVDHSNRSNALIILKNGNTTLNGSLTIDADNVGGDDGYTLPAQDGSADQIMVTDGDGNLTWENSGSGAFSTTSNVTSNQPGDYSSDDFVFGSPQLDDDGNTDHDSRMFFDKSKRAFRTGSTDADQWDDSNLGLGSAAFGFSTIASGNNSLASGNRSVASGNSSVTLGFQTTASGDYSIALGNQSIASGFVSTAIGHGTLAKSYAEIAIGSYSTDYTPTSTTNDRLFVIGNGFDNSTRSDALILYKNGNATLSGTLTETSDRRLKKDISHISDTSSKLKELNGVNFRWNSVKPHDTLSLQTGFIAQEVEQLFPELVKEDSEGYKSVNYIGLIPHLVEAIKELKAENDKLKNELTRNNQIQSSRLDELETRLRIIENQSLHPKKKNKSNRAKTRAN